MTRRVRIDLPVLLPEVTGRNDACIARLENALAALGGITEAHVRPAQGEAPAVLCLHYDPAVVSLASVERAARKAGVTITQRYGHIVFPMRVVAGEDANRRIENDIASVDGVLGVTMNLAAQRLGIEFDRTLTSADQLRNHINQAGYESGSPIERNGDGTCCRPKESIPADSSWYRRNKELAWSIAAGAFLALAWGGERWAGLTQSFSIPIFLAAYGFGAYDLVRHWIAGVRKGQISFDIDLLMLLAAIGAALLGEWAEGAFLLFLFSLAHALEHYALGRARNAIKALSELAPSTAYVLRDGATVEVPIENVAIGETVVVRPAERIPVDGKVKSGYSAVNQAPITGESVPVEKTTDDDVFAGTINGTGALQVTVSKVAGDRTLDRVIRMVEEAQTQKAPTQLFTERFERIFVPAVLIADILLIVVPPLLGFWPWSVSFYRGMSLLVAASPCALALGTPAAVLTAIAQAARNGVLIKGGAHLENLGQLRAIAFDKTGTLTVGEPEVTDLGPFAPTEAAELLGTSASVEQHSQHPLAQAVVRRAHLDRVMVPQSGDLQSLTARGVRSVVDGQTVELGNLRLWEEMGVSIPDRIKSDVAALQAGGKSTIIAKHGERWLGVIGVADQPRAGVNQILSGLREIGITELVMLTGDNKGVGAAIAADVGITDVRAELLPEDKVTAIRELAEKHGLVAMVGDGVNDAPALAHATVGIAMGGAGTAVALETADVALMGDDLSKLGFAVGLSRRARGVIRQNLFISMAVIATLVLATTTGFFGIGAAVLVHEGSTLIVIANALRLLGFKPAPA